MAQQKLGLSLWWYQLRVNLAIEALNVKTNLIKSEFKALMGLAGREDSNTPEEVAVWVVSQLPISIRVDVD
jgi:hypothetical protein